MIAVNEARHRNKVIGKVENAVDNNIKRLEELEKVVSFQLENGSHYGIPATTTLVGKDVLWLIEQTGENIRRKEVAHENYWYVQELENTILELGECVNEYRKTVNSMKEEVEYALHSNKSKEVKQHYLENAVRYAEDILENE